MWRRGQDIDDEKMSNGAERLLAKSGFIEMENEVRVIFSLFFDPRYAFRPWFIPLSPLSKKNI